MLWLFSCDLSMSFEELVFCLALGPSLTLTTHSGLRIGMLSCFSVRLRLWDAGLTWPEWDITQNMNLPIIMFIPHVHVCVQGHDHVCTSLDEHEIHSNREPVIWKYEFAFILLIHACIFWFPFPTILETRYIPELAISNVDKWHVIKVSL